MTQPGTSSGPVAFAGPHITLSDWQSGAKTDLDLFEDQTRTWLFEQANALAPGQHAGPAILTLVTPYFEAIACYLQGEASSGRSTAFLKAGLVEVLPGLKADLEAGLAKRFADEVRHGFAHEAIFRKVGLTRNATGGPPLGIDAAGSLWVDPWELLARAERHFNGYVAALRAGKDAALVGNFNAFMAIRKTR